MTKFAYLTVIGLTLAGISIAENIGTVRQPLVGGSVIDEARQEEFGLLALSVSGGSCSASLLRNGWAITAAHCVDAKDGFGNFMADPARPGQNLLKPIATMQLTAKWKTVQMRNAVRVETFRPYDVALIQLDAPFMVHGYTAGYSRLVFQDGQFPYFGEPVGAPMLVFGQGISIFAHGEGDSAVPSFRDGLYRMTYAKPTRDADNRYWYPSVGGQMIAGGDSGGPSFAWVLSGYALVGVHSLTHADYVPGKPKTGWDWVTGTPEAADAPIAPVLQAINRIMGPAPPAPWEYSLEPPPPGFIGTFARTPPGYQPVWLYGIRPNGELVWYRKDSGAAAWQGPKKVGTGWQSFKDVIPAGGNSFYALTYDGKLLWYRHDGFNDGSFTWPPAVEVGSGWNFARIFSGGQGIVYAIAKDGTLLWYRNNGADHGLRSWQAAKVIGSGWTQFKDVFSTGLGAIYAVHSDGRLSLYRHDGYETGDARWQADRVVGAGWNKFQQIVPSTDGVIMGILPDGKLLWYKPRAVATRALGRIALTTAVTSATASAAPRSICDAARDARARNSPAAPGLEAQCRAFNASQATATINAASAYSEFGKTSDRAVGIYATLMQPTLDTADAPEEIGSGWQDFGKVIALIADPPTMPR
jgi:hypothetical protein